MKLWCCLIITTTYCSFYTFKMYTNLEEKNEQSFQEPYVFAMHFDRPLSLRVGPSTCLSIEHNEEYGFHAIDSNTNTIYHVTESLNPIRQWEISHSSPHEG
jgi:hypothetical protein